MHPLQNDIATTSWQVITHFGSASLVLPIVVLISAGLLRTGQVAVLRAWILGLMAAIGLTLATKIAYLGWGLGHEAFDFTGISGHTILAASVLPVLLAWLLAGDQPRSVYVGAVLGLLIAAVVGVSRVMLDTHSPSEVIVAWVLGAAITGVAVQGATQWIRPPWFVKAAPLVLLMSFSTPASTYLPSHELEIAVALMLSGRQQPYRRPLERTVGERPVEHVLR